MEFLRLLDEDNALRVGFEVDRGTVLKFVVQLECRFGEGDDWTAIVRYDTAHGFAHVDRLHPYGDTVKAEMPTQDYKEALNVAIDDLANNWADYRRRYEEWLRNQ